MADQPAAWRRLLLRDICTVRQGLQIPISKRFSQPGPNRYLYVTIQQINHPERPPEFIENPKPTVICGPDDVLMSRTGNTGTVVTGVTGVFHNNFFLIDYNRGLVDRGYLVNYLLLEDVQHEIAIRAGTSTIPDLNHTDFYTIPILLPPILEQRKIANILASWDRAVDLATHLIAVKQKRKHGLVQQLLTGKQRFSFFQNQWSSVTFGQVFSAKHIRNTGSRIRTPITVGKYAIRPQNEHFNRVVASENIGNYNIIECGDFVYDPMSAYYGAFGRYELDEPGIVSPVYRVLRVSPGYDSDFVKHLIKSHHITYQLAANSSQGNRHGKRRTIQEEAFDSIRVAIPSMDEQRMIARVLNACDRELALLERKVTLLKQQKRGLMQQLLSGKVRVAA